MIGSDVIAISLPRSSSNSSAAPKGVGSRGREGQPPIENALPTSTPDPLAPATDFIAGPENRLAGAAAGWLLDRSERTYSPLVLHGPSGCGKSLLAHGLAGSREQVAFTTGADFVREVAAAIDTNTLTEFRELYRSAELVVIEDLTDLADRRSAQRELINLLDVLELREVPVVVTTRIPPSEIADLPPALRSRLSGGLQIALTPPGIAARAEILHRLAAGREIEIEPAALQLLAESVSGTVPELQGALHELAALVEHDDAIRLANVRRLLDLRRIRRQPNIATIIKVVAKYYGLKPTKLTGPARSRQVSLARSMAIYLGRKLTGQSLEGLGKYFGNRDHSTVLYNYRTLESRLETDAELRAAVDRLQRELVAE